MKSSHSQVIVVILIVESRNAVVLCHVVQGCMFFVDGVHYVSFMIR